jgi:protein arginine N-methyltransferase 2
VTKSGRCHGFGSWFDTGFPSPHNRDEASSWLYTGPGHELTHWKQDLFVLDTPIELLVGDTVKGRVVIQRNPYWRRHCTVTFHFSHWRNEEMLKSYEKKFALWRE